MGEEDEKMIRKDLIITALKISKHLWAEKTKDQKESNSLLFFFRLKVPHCRLLLNISIVDMNGNPTYINSTTTNDLLFLSIYF